MEHLISEPITVELRESGEVGAFLWRGARYAVDEVLSDFRRVDFHSPWYLRRHQRRLLVRVHSRFFEIYVIRPGHWVLYREHDNPLGD